MNKAIIGKKLGMTQVFMQDGTMVPVTVVQAGPCTVVQKKTVERDGYSAIQLGFEEVADRKLNKPEQGHLKKANAGSLKHLKEFKLDNADALELGAKIECDVFAEGDFVDVTGTTKGRGFTGVIKRWNQGRLKETHGVGPVHREVGSMGANSTPSRVLPGKHMPGQYGVEQVTVLNLSVIKVDKERGVLLIKGAIPGAKNSIVYVRNAVKK
ncbi:MAG TPA: 50S ribosomal protein L3 [Candidatus Limihabitans stercoravium]|nr:50S ribosomal protein L3 [Candidatus Limihabitans stercoravium]